MDLMTVQQAQASLDKLQKCQNLRCVFDFFASEVSRNSREDIYIFLKDQGPARVLKECESSERPRKMIPQEVCFRVNLKKIGDVQVLWRNDKGQWKLSNASQRER